jgi:hypothetical protein
MAITLVTEDGTGKADANTYATTATADTYFAAHLNASAWTSASADNKAAALAFATRLIDAEFQFGGYRSNTTQALQWPRTGCIDPDAGSISPIMPGVRSRSFIATNVIPANVIRATCEMARELLIVDRTGAPMGEGLASSKIGTTALVFDPATRRPVLSQLAQAMLSKYGNSLQNRSHAARLVRT